MLGLLSDTFMTATRAAAPAPRHDAPRRAPTRPAAIAAVPVPRGVTLIQRLRAARAGFASGIAQTAPATGGAVCG